MKEIILNKSIKTAIVDDNVFDFLSIWKWRHTPNGYVVRSVNFGKGVYKTYLMHRVVLEFNGINIIPGYETDHVNGNKLDNQLSNLRPVSRMLNSLNQNKKSNNTSGYKGVFRKRDKWAARLTYDGHHYNLGVFSLKENAARAYDKKAIELTGQFARLNFSL